MSFNSAGFHSDLISMRMKNLREVCHCCAQSTDEDSKLIQCQMIFKTLLQRDGFFWRTQPVFQWITAAESVPTHKEQPAHDTSE